MYIRSRDPIIYSLQGKGGDTQALAEGIDLRPRSNSMSRVKATKFMLSQRSRAKTA